MLFRLRPRVQEVVAEAVLVAVVAVEVVDGRIVNGNLWSQDLRLKVCPVKFSFKLCNHSNVYEAWFLLTIPN